MIRRKKGTYGQEIHCLLYATKTIIQDLHGKDSEGKNQTMAAINLLLVTTIPKPVNKDCYAGSAKSTI